MTDRVDVGRDGVAARVDMRVSCALSCPCNRDEPGDDWTVYACEEADEEQELGAGESAASSCPLGLGRVDVLLGPVGLVVLPRDGLSACTDAQVDVDDGGGSSGLDALHRDNGLSNDLGTERVCFAIPHECFQHPLGRPGEPDSLLPIPLDDIAPRHARDIHERLLDPRRRGIVEELGFGFPVCEDAELEGRLGVLEEAAAV